MIVVELTLMLIRISSLKRLRVVLLIELVRVHRRWPSRKTLCPTGKVDQRGQEQGKEEERISLTILVPEEEEREESPILRSLVLLPRPVCHAFGQRRTGVCHIMKPINQHLRHPTFDGAILVMGDFDWAVLTGIF